MFCTNKPMTELCISTTQILYVTKKNNNGNVNLSAEMSLSLLGDI